MLITLYKSSLCPRCYFAKKALLELVKKNPSLRVEEVDILTSPGKTFRSGITMIPAIKIGNKMLSSIYLSPKKIDEFVTSSIL